MSDEEKKYYEEVFDRQASDGISKDELKDLYRDMGKYPPFKGYAGKTRTWTDDDYDRSVNALSLGHGEV